MRIPPQCLLVGLASLALGSTSVTAAVLATYEFTGGSVSTTGVDPGITISTFHTSGGLGSVSYANGYADASTANIAGTAGSPGSLSASITAGDYYEFTITPDSGSSITFDNLTFLAAYFNAAGGSVGDSYATTSITYYLMADIIGFTAADVIGSATKTGLQNVTTWAAAAAAGNVQSLSIDIANSAFASDFENITGPVTFRLYVSDTNASGRNAAIDSVALNGIVAVPEPSAALLGGLGSVLLLRRRRS
ncbi:MAG: hypothetical protein QM680_04970 [Luteolibacter sp.]